MKIEHINASQAPAPGGSYSHGVVAHGFLYTCGMGPVDPATGKIVDGGVDFKEPTKDFGCEGCKVCRCCKGNCSPTRC
jgi:enamine deaminase RidA (YjgF/YER057c/UK114 family)